MPLDLSPRYEDIPALAHLQTVEWTDQQLLDQTSDSRTLWPKVCRHRTVWIHPRGVKFSEADGYKQLIKDILELWRGKLSVLCLHSLAVRDLDRYAWAPASSVPVDPALMSKKDKEAMGREKLEAHKKKWRQYRARGPVLFAITFRAAIDAQVFMTCLTAEVPTATPVIIDERALSTRLPPQASEIFQAKIGGRGHILAGWARPSSHLHAAGIYHLPLNLVIFIFQSPQAYPIPAEVQGLVDIANPRPVRDAVRRYLWHNLMLSVEREAAGKKLLDLRLAYRHFPAGLQAQATFNLVHEPYYTALIAQDASMFDMESRSVPRDRLDVAEHGGILDLEEVFDGYELQYSRDPDDPINLAMEAPFMMVEWMRSRQMAIALYLAGVPPTVSEQRRAALGELLTVSQMMRLIESERTMTIDAMPLTLGRELLDSRSDIPEVGADLALRRVDDSLLRFLPLGSYVLMGSIVRALQRRLNERRRAVAPEPGPPAYRA